MKRTVLLVCLAALLLDSSLPTLTNQSLEYNSTSEIIQFARGDKKVHSPIHIRSNSIYSTNVM